MSINLGIDVSGISALLQRASALRDGNRAQREANERLSRVEGRSTDLGLSGKAAGQKTADSIESKAQKRVADQRRQQDGLTDRKPIGHRHGGGYPVAVAWTHQWDSIYKTTYATTYAPDQPVVYYPNRCPSTLYAKNGRSVEVTLPDVVSPHLDVSEYAREPFTDRLRADRPNIRYYADHYGRSPELDQFSLPVGPDTQLVCFSVSIESRWERHEPDAQGSYYEFVSGSTSYINASDSIRIFLVSPTTLREVSVPSAFRDIIEEVEEAYTDNRFRLAFNPLLTPQNGGGNIGFKLQGEYGIYRPNYNLPSTALHTTPSIFPYLTKYKDAPHEYLDVNNPSDEEEIVEYYDDYVFANYTGPWLSVYQPEFLDGEPVYPTELIYPIQKRNLQAPYAFSSTRPNPRSKVTVPPSVTAAYNEYQNQYQGGPRTFLHSTWDWGKPSYCRQQLLALGFTAADLTP